ncbi:unnamed protein product [Prorocentrum cordatum]|uniref:Uncharacterized protein n=1 Tax=Prorocentrum cordatum TaxID=2364126 RepID=A0ABN9U4S4_9DINO|nr:unnamed protein product [Polarella glacialis]
MPAAACSFERASARCVALRQASLGELVAAREGLQSRVAAMSRRAYVVRMLADDRKRQALELSRWTAFGIMGQVSEKYFGCGCDCSGRDRREVIDANAGPGHERDGCFPEPLMTHMLLTPPPSARGSPPPSARGSTAHSTRGSSPPSARGSPPGVQGSTPPSAWKSAPPGARGSPPPSARGSPPRAQGSNAAQKLSLYAMD